MRQNAHSEKGSKTYYANEYLSEAPAKSAQHMVFRAVADHDGFSLLFFYPDRCLFLIFSNDKRPIINHVGSNVATFECFTVTLNTPWCYSVIYFLKDTRTVNSRLVVFII